MIKVVSGGKIVVMMHLEAGSTGDDFRKREMVVVFLEILSSVDGALLLVMMI